MSNIQIPLLLFKTREAHNAFYSDFQVAIYSCKVRVPFLMHSSSMQINEEYLLYFPQINTFLMTFYLDSLAP